jgi:hypothetical protein
MLWNQIAEGSHYSRCRCIRMHPGLLSMICTLISTCRAKWTSHDGGGLTITFPSRIQSGLAASRCVDAPKLSIFALKIVC